VTNYNLISEAILKQAKEKGWGHDVDTFDVARKMLLIQTEITEVQEILIDGKQNLLEKDSLECELADIVIRSLHLGAVYKVDFDKSLLETNLSSPDFKNTQEVLLRLYKEVSMGFEGYRHKEMEQFLRCPVSIIQIVLGWAQELGVDIQQAITLKSDINAGRSWDHGKKSEGLG
jgi:hypothetical protein